MWYVQSLIEHRQSSPALAQGDLTDSKRVSESRVSFNRNFEGETSHIEIRFDRGEVLVNSKLIGISK
jgi:hypothetical protein